MTNQFQELLVNYSGTEEELNLFDKLVEEGKE